LATARAEDRIRAEFTLVGGAVDFKQGHIDGFLFDSIKTDQRVGNIAVDVLNSLGHALAHIVGFITVTQFECFVNAGRGARRHGCASPTAIGQHNFHFHGRVAAGVEYLSPNN
jgi:hypothetical protein